MNTQEDAERSEMIVSMEKTLNPGWFYRSKEGREKYCTLAVSQYWDWITYIDVSLSVFALYQLIALDRMTTFLSGRLSRWRNCTPINFRKWHVNVVYTSLLDGFLLILLWDQFFAPRPRTSSLDSPLPSPSPCSSTFRVLTGKDLIELSTRSSVSPLPTVHISVAPSRSTSPSGGIKPLSNFMSKVSLFLRCNTTTGKPTCQKVTPLSIQTGIERVGHWSQTTLVFKRKNQEH